VDFYIEDAIGIQDFPLGWIEGISETKQQQVAELVKFLRTEEVQARIQSQGYFRTGLVGMTISHPDKNIFNPEWGIITNQNFLPASLPKDAVIIEALNMYQTLFKPPSVTAWCLDYSPSMRGSGEKQRNLAMEIILDQAQASRHLLQAGPADVTLVLAFSDHVIASGIHQGNDPAALRGIYDQLLTVGYGRGTNIFGCIIDALQEASAQTQPGSLPAIIVLTDGEHNSGSSFRDLKKFYTDSRLTIPIHSIMLGSASTRDLNPVMELSQGRICDGRGSQEALINCFKEFRGSN
jgi:Ca-activated chloride channel homolog